MTWPIPDSEFAYTREPNRELEQWEIDEVVDELQRRLMAAMAIPPAILFGGTPNGYGAARDVPADDPPRDGGRDHPERVHAP